MAATGRATTRRTLVSFHAHPDDECITVGGTIARAADAGHRVVIVFATRGEIGEPREGVLAPGETLGARREQEARDAALILGAQRVEFLGYRDSGMEGTDTVHEAGTFWSADVGEAAARLARILDEERADVFTHYDDHGNYGHPDHVQVHRVGAHAASLVSVPRVYAATMNRDHVRAQMQESIDELPAEVERPTVDLSALGVPAGEITTTVDVHGVLDRKRAAMVAHRSQIGAENFFLSLPDEQFRVAFGLEWFVRLDSTPAVAEDWIFEPGHASTRGRRR